MLGNITGVSGVFMLRSSLFLYRSLPDSPQSVFIKSSGRGVVKPLAGLDLRGVVMNWSSESLSEKINYRSVMLRRWSDSLFSTSCMLTLSVKPMIRSLFPAQCGFHLRAPSFFDFPLSLFNGCQTLKPLTLPLLCLEALLRNIESVSELLKSLSLVSVF